MKENLGPLTIRTDIRSSMGPFRLLPEYKIAYTSAMKAALGELYMEYNNAFRVLAECNREHEGDYKHCLIDGSPVNWVVQIDMIGASPEFIGITAHMPKNDLREILRRRIFEIENSLAMYQLLERLFEREGSNSTFKDQYRGVLDALRSRFGRPIALLAVTHQKHAAMLATEYGKTEGEILTDREVHDLSGFDRLFGPDDFRAHVGNSGGKCEYLLYVRASDPVDKLRNPDRAVDHPLLGDHSMRSIIKAHAVTFNVDDPTWAIGDPRRINDTKHYMSPMRMGFLINTERDLLDPGLTTHMSRGRSYMDYPGRRLSEKFEAFLAGQGVDPEAVAAGKAAIRCKPAQGAYGCYGHVSGLLSEKEIRNTLRGNLKRRGPYFVQPEMTTPRIVNLYDGSEYLYIDRVFMSMTDSGPVFLGGFRDLMPVMTTEAREGRIHGNTEAVWAEII